MALVDVIDFIRDEYEGNFFPAYTQLSLSGTDIVGYSNYQRPGRLNTRDIENIAKDWIANGQKLLELLEK